MDSLRGNLHRQELDRSTSVFYNKHETKWFHFKFSFISNSQGGFNAMTTPAHGPVPDIRKTVLLNAPIQKVWDAVSTAEGISAWFMPNDFKAELGFVFSIQSPYGTLSCRVEELDPPKRLVFTWGDEWVLSFNLVELEGKTEFTLVHSGWGEADAVIAQTGMKHGFVRDRMDQGWEQIVLQGLRKHIEE
jgi:uncharacterized protein YndB with AHSA1/START domain